MVGRQILTHLNFCPKTNRAKKKLITILLFEYLDLVEGTDDF